MRYLGAASLGVSFAIWILIAWVWLLAWSAGATSRIGYGRWEHSDMELICGRALMYSSLVGLPICFLGLHSKATRSARLSVALFAIGFLVVIAHMPLFE